MIQFIFNIFIDIFPSCHYAVRARIAYTAEGTITNISRNTCGVTVGGSNTALML